MDEILTLFCGILIGIATSLITKMIIDEQGAKKRKSGKMSKVRQPAN
jgi:hypothetical protein